MKLRVDETVFVTIRARRAVRILVRVEIRVKLRVRLQR